MAKSKYILPSAANDELVAETIVALKSQIIDKQHSQLKKRTTPVGSFQENLGEQVNALREKNDNNPDTSTIRIMDLTREMMKDWPAYLEKAIDEGIKKLKGDFFICILLKEEKIMREVHRVYFVTRDTCPTPNYDQTVYHYIRDTQQLRYLWTIPDRDLCFEFLENAHKIEAADKDLLKMIHMFGTGQLLRWSQKLNGEDQEDYTKKSLIITDL